MSVLVPVFAVPALPLARRPDRPSPSSRPARAWRAALCVLAAALAFPAAASAQQRTVLKNQEARLPDVPYGPDTVAAVVSRDGSRAVVVARAGQQHEEWVVQDGHQAESYLALAKGTPILSEDGKHCAYAGSRESESLGEKLWFVVYDGSEQGPFFYVQPNSLALNADGTFLACVVRRRDGKEAVCVLSQDPSAQPPARVAGDPAAPAPPAAPPPGQAAAAAPQPPIVPPAVVQKEMGKWYDRIGDHAPQFSPNGKYLTYAAFQDDNKWHVLVNGVGSGAYDSVGPVRFSGSSEVAAYVGRRQGKAVAVTVPIFGAAAGGIGSEGPPQNEILENSLAFSYDGKHLAYVVGKPGARRVIADGREVVPIRQDNAGGAAPATGPATAPAVKPAAAPPAPPPPTFDEVAEDSLVYSPDGLHLAFTACRGKQWFLIRDGVESRPYEGLSGPPVYSLDGKHLACVVERVAPAGAGRHERVERFVVLDGVEQKPYERIPSAPVFSADGKRCAYVAERGGQTFVVVDGMEGKSYSCIRGRPVLSPDGSRCAFTALPPDSIGRFSAAEDVVRDPTDPSAGSRLVFDRSPSFRGLSEDEKKQPVQLLLVEERVVEE